MPWVGGTRPLCTAARVSLYIWKRFIRWKTRALSYLLSSCPSWSISLAYSADTGSYGAGRSDSSCSLGTGKSGSVAPTSWKSSCNLKYEQTSIQLMGFLKLPDKWQSVHLMARKFSIFLWKKSKYLPDWGFKSTCGIIHQETHSVDFAKIEFLEVEVGLRLN